MKRKLFKKIIISSLPFYIFYAFIFSLIMITISYFNCKPDEIAHNAGIYLSEHDNYLMNILNMSANYKESFFLALCGFTLITVLATIYFSKSIYNKFSLDFIKLNLQGFSFSKCQSIYILDNFILSLICYLLGVTINIIFVVVINNLYEIDQQIIFFNLPNIIMLICFIIFKVVVDLIICLKSYSNKKRIEAIRGEGLDD